MRKLALVVFLLSAIPAAAQNWPSFRGPSGSGVATGGGPLAWDATKGTNIAWRTSIPGMGHSSPIVWGDRIYVTTAVPLQASPDQDASSSGDMIFANDLVKHSWRLYALDRETGRIIWQVVASEGVPAGKRILKSSHANPTPATNGEFIVGAFGDGTLACFDSSGRLRWRRKFTVPAFTNAEDGLNDIVSSPIIYKNLIIHLHDHEPVGYLAAYDLRTGDEVWKVERDEKNTWSTPAIVTAGGKPVLVTNSWRGAHGHDPATGKELWRMKARKGSWDRGPLPLQAGELTIIAGGGPEQPIFAIRSSAEGDLSIAVDAPLNKHVAWVTGPGSPYLPTPVVVGDRLYSVTDKGILSAFDIRNGNRIYQERVSPEATGFSASPVVAGGKLYLAGEDGEIFVVRTGDKFELLASNPMGEITYATPAVSGDMLIVRTATHIYAIREGAAPAHASSP